MKRAAIYTRVSTDEQAEKGYSLPSQLEACRRYAQQQDMQVVAEFQDDYSGAKLERPAFSKLRDMIRRGELDAVIVYCADRLTRNLAHSLILRDEFERANVERHTVARGKSGGSAESRMIENVEGVFAEYEREKIRERSTRGSWRKAQEGKIVGAVPPYGYSRVNDMLVINDAEARVVRCIFEWYVKGDGRGKPLTFYAIGRKLSEMLIPTPGETRGKARKRPSGMWSLIMIKRIITNETYTGVWRYGRHIGENGRGGKRPDGLHVVIDVPALVSPEMWKAACDQLAFNKQVNRRNAKRNYLLRGLLRCGKCDRAMGGIHKRSDGIYRCGGKTQRFYGLEARCNQPDVSVKKLDTLVWGYVVETMMDASRFERLLRQAMTAESLVQRQKHERLDTVLRLMAESEAAAANLAQTLSRVSGGVVGKALQAEIDAVENNFRALAQEKATLEKDLPKNVLTEADITSAMKFRETVIAGLHNATFEDKRRYFELLRVKVSVDGDNVTVSCRVAVAGWQNEVPAAESSEVKSAASFSLQTGSHSCRGRRWPSTGCQGRCA